MMVVYEAYFDTFVITRPRIKSSAIIGFNGCLKTQSINLKLGNDTMYQALVCETT